MMSKNYQRHFICQKTSKDVIYLPRMHLHYEGNELFVFGKNPFGFGTDSWIIFNDGNLFFTVNSSATCEELRAPRRRGDGLWIYFHLPNKMMFEISNYHFHSVRQRRGENGVKGITPFDDWVKKWDGNVVDTLDNKTYSSELLDKKLLDKEFIMCYVRQFE